MTEATKKFIESALANIHDLLATIFGIILAAMVATQIDYEKLMAGDKGELAKLIGAVVITAHGYITNKKRKPGTE